VRPLPRNACCPPRARTCRTRSAHLAPRPRSYDEHSHEKFPPGDPSKRAFTYFILTGGRFIYASALRLAVLKFVLSMTVRGPSVRATAASTALQRS